VSKGFSLEQAGITSALGIGFSVPAPFIVGSLIGKLKAGHLAVFLIALTGLVQVLLPLASEQSVISVLVVASGVLQASTSTSIFVMLTELVSRQSLPLISGWCVALGYGGAALGPVLFGKIVDVASFFSSFTTFAILNLLCITAIILNNRRREPWSP
jgi:CP family cyanate transporter-like MFS transporter